MGPHSPQKECSDAKTPPQTSYLVNEGGGKGYGEPAWRSRDAQAKVIILLQGKIRSQSMQEGRIPIE